MADTVGKPQPVALPEPEAAADLGARSREFLGELRERAHQWHTAGGGGTEVVQYFTAGMDSLVCFLAQSAALTWRQRYVQGDDEISVLAQGGYGRGELNPCSDIDLLILLPHKVTPYAEATTETILYALWDARLQVGHAVRNVRDCVRLAAGDLKIKTALLDARYLCGAEDLAAEFATALDEEIAGRGETRFYREKVAESESRYREFGDSVYLLEPQIKEGRGGLRDLHTAMWIAKIQYRVKTLQDLAAQAVLTQAELDEILASRDFVFRVRNSLHFTTGTHADQLTFELQDQVAEDLGYGVASVTDPEPVENFLRDYYRKASVITRFSREFIARAVNPSSAYKLIGKVMARTIRAGVQIVNNELAVSDESLFERDPVELLRVVRDAQRHGVALASELEAAIRDGAHRFGEDQRADPRTAEYFLAILRSPWRVYETMHDLHRLGLLERILPEWEHLVCLVRRNHFHIYTVDEHSLMGIRELERLRRGEVAEELPLLTQVMREEDDSGLLFLATMLHDVGKGTRGDHSEEGAALAEAIGRRLGLDEDEVQELRFLVRNHLVLALFAEQRDLNDEKTALDLAGIVGSPEILRRLFLLTYGDMRSTNPKMWNSWKDMVLGEAYMRVSEVFAHGFSGEGRETRMARIRERVLEQATREGGEAAREELAGFLDSVSESWLLSTPEAEMPAHAQLVREAGESGLATRVTHEPARGFSEFTVATTDIPGLFSTITGVLAASGFHVLTARIATTDSGIALDSFRLAHAEAADVVMDDGRWQRAVDLLREVLAGEAEIEEKLARNRDSGLLRRRLPKRAINAVLVDDESSDDFLVLDVYASDRPGLLHEVAHAIHELGLRVHLAKIATNVDQAVDIFFVTEEDGSKPNRAAEIRSVLISELDRFEAASLEAEAGSGGAAAGDSR